MSCASQTQLVLGVASRQLLKGQKFQYFWGAEDAENADEVGWYSAQIVERSPDYDLAQSTQLTIRFYEEGTYLNGTCVFNNLIE